jgi:ABC-type polysaccharide/polyol phosphate export permease
LLSLLIKRDFIARYRKSVLGVLWSLLNPLLTMLVMTTVFSYLFKRDIQNFPVYMLSGQLIYGLFKDSTTEGMNSIIRNEGMIKKIYIPKYIFTLSKVLSSLINTVFSLLAFLIVFVVTGAKFHWTFILIPIPIMYVFVFSFGVAMLLSAMAVFFRDLTYLYGILTLLLMYMTPIFYPATIIPNWLEPYYGLNPLYQFLTYFRNLALYGIIPGLWDNLVCIGFSLCAFCIGVYVFMTKQNKYILHL